MNWETGTSLQSGKYLIQKILGQGGFGITYLAKETATGSLVAIKTLNEKVRKRPDFIQCQQDFLNEALRLAKCSHPYIVEVHELIFEEPVWCVVMEYINGIDVASLIQEEGILSEFQALVYIGQIAQALIFVHHQGILHRDVKPLNILITNNRTEARLIDFGLARKFTPNLTQTHTEYTSEGFSPLEQYDKRALRGAYTDVYGLAATLYGMLTGKAPKPALKRYRSFSQYQEDPLVPPKKLNHLISQQVNDAILKGMALEPQNRPNSISNWLKLLDLDIKFNPNYAVQEMPALPTAEWSSATGIDYSKLRDLLAAGNWQEADRETGNLMLLICGREKEGKLNIDDLQNFPQRDLLTLDNLWREYSLGRFGFSIQGKLWQKINGKYEDFCNLIGWRKKFATLPYNQLIFNITAPQGHLPTWGRRGQLWPHLAAKILDLLKDED
ncbi:serine/threonine-protein kinase [Ancylothrix sp. C2]|uniref:serine/threonine-protein kinase n=1 Tax=Ancylothrix sp. D3o TaxID=2953691 RepID=UPI0021BB120E|nr:serine/threonine-protein kinase [Ancylothrix sp. D3o]MCT7948661.1 serine/threonine-protein kinase [Ancylothrix sp. D3o]